ncbi:hypothetical protein FRC12_005873 [Ceratobasidium sp. 428]|nr:hypothetical protein FRC12_005873 [Ceratobasidium sp. 428]
MRKDFVVFTSCNEFLVTAALIASFVGQESGHDVKILVTAGANVAAHVGQS